MTNATEACINIFINSKDLKICVTYKKENHEFMIEGQDENFIKDYYWFLTRTFSIYFTAMYNINTTKFGLHLTDEVLNKKDEYEQMLNDLKEHQYINLEDLNNKFESFKNLFTHACCTKVRNMLISIIKISLHAVELNLDTENIDMFVLVSSKYNNFFNPLFEGR